MTITLLEKQFKQEFGLAAEQLRQLDAVLQGRQLPLTK